MQPRFNLFTGYFLQQFYFEPSHTPGPRTELFNQRRVDILRGIVSNDHGDRVQPNNQEYDTWLENHWDGTSHFEVTGAYSIDDSGPRGFGSYPIPQDDQYDFLYNSCLSKMYDEVRGGIDLAVEAAQGGQTIGMVRGATKVVGFARDLVLSVKSHRPRGVISEFLDKSGRRFNKTKTVGELWLEYQYGWRPFVQTVFDCVDAIVKPSLTDRFPLLVLKTRAKVNSKIDVRRISNVRSNFGDYHPETITGFASQRGEMMVQWRIPPSRLLDFSRWSSMNPSSIAWELLPYSFVVDWFVDVGGWLRNLESACLYNTAFVRGYFTHTQLYSTVFKINGSIPYSSIGFETADLEGFHYITKKKRVAMTSAFPRAPTISPHLGPQRLLSAAGLLSGFLGRK